MPKKQTPQELWETALAAFPYKDLESTSISQGDLDSDGAGEIAYSEEFSFEVGNLLGESLVAGGWIEYRQDEDEVYITGFFGIARSADWEKGRILGESEALQASFDFNTQTWEFWIDSY